MEQLSALKGEPSWMRERRLAAWEAFERLPLPTVHDEEWRRTNISSLDLNALVPYTPAGGVEIASPLRLDGENGGLVTHANSVSRHGDPGR